MARRAASRSADTEFLSVIGAGFRLQICILLLLSGLATSAAADDERPTRLNDALGGGTDWDIAMPGLEPRRGFDAAIRAGDALDSAAYVALDRQLRRITRRLDQDSEDAAALAELGVLREQLRRRVQLNVDAGYFYAAGVYIELLRLADAPSAEVQDLTRMLRASRG